MSLACFIVQPFYKRSAQKGQSKQHCVCIKEKQNNSSQSFLRNPSTLKLPLAHVWKLVCMTTPWFWAAGDAIWEGKTAEERLGPEASWNGGRLWTREERSRGQGRIHDLHRQNVWAQGQELSRSQWVNLESNLAPYISESLMHTHDFDYSRVPNRRHGSKKI